MEISKAEDISTKRDLLIKASASIAAVILAISTGLLVAQRSQLSAELEKARSARDELSAKIAEMTDGHATMKAELEKLQAEKSPTLYEQSLQEEKVSAFAAQAAACNALRKKIKG